jgi:hypothetical protein
MTLPRDQANVSATGVLSVEEVATFDTAEIVNGILTVTTRVAPDVDRTFVTADGMLTVVDGVGVMSSIFADGTEGFYFDFSRLDRLWQDSAGTTPVASAGQNIGRALSLDPDAVVASQATTAAQPKWQTGGLARFDGSDDSLLTTLTPGAAMSLMFKCKLTSLLAAGAYLTGSRVTGTDSRFYLGFDASEQLHAIIGATTVTRTGSLHDTIGVAGLVLSGGNATLYWNGVGETPGAVGSPNTTIALPLGAINISAVIQSFFPGDIYYALAIKKALSAAEISAITNLWGTS